ncbi:MAG: FimV/HubP family polar landmark protein [Cocleimonas sp.]
MLVTAQSVAAEIRYTIESTDSLVAIIDDFYQDSSLTDAQIMVGVLANNPSAFKGGNLNYLIAGKTLSLPNDDDLKNISNKRANEILSYHSLFYSIGHTGDIPAPDLKKLYPSEEEESAGDTLESSNTLDNPSDNSLSTEVETLEITSEENQLKQESIEFKRQIEVLLNEENEKEKERLSGLENSSENKPDQDVEKVIPAVEVVEKADKIEKIDLQEKNKTNKKVTAKGMTGESSQPSIEEESPKTVLAPPKEPKIDTPLESEVKNVLEKKVEKKAIGSSPEESPSIEKADITAVVKVDKSVNEIENATSSSNIAPATNKESLSARSKWLIPLLLLIGFLFYIINKKKPKAEPVEDTIASYQAAFDKSNEHIHTETDKEPLESSVKLDVARAYIEAEDTQSALDILTEIMDEGSDELRQQARDLLEILSPKRH